MSKKFHIKKGDLVQVNAGEDRGKQGKVLEMIPDKQRAIVEGINLVSKHTKPNATHPQGGIIKKEAPIHISNLNVVDPVEIKEIVEKELQELIKKIEKKEPPFSHEYVKNDYKKAFKDSINEQTINKYKEEILNGADPVIKNELIPVTIENDGTVKKADITKEWYNYENKKWANAVILKDTGKIESDVNRMSICKNQFMQKCTISSSRLAKRCWLTC